MRSDGDKSKSVIRQVVDVTQVKELSLRQESNEENQIIVAFYGSRILWLEKVPNADKFPEQSSSLVLRSVALTGSQGFRTRDSNKKDTLNPIHNISTISLPERLNTKDITSLQLDDAQALLAVRDIRGHVFVVNYS